MNVAHEDTGDVDATCAMCDDGLPAIRVCSAGCARAFCRLCTPFAMHASTVCHHCRASCQDTHGQRVDCRHGHGTHAESAPNPCSIRDATVCMYARGADPICRDCRTLLVSDRSTALVLCAFCDFAACPACANSTQQAAAHHAACSVALARFAVIRCRERLSTNIDQTHTKDA